ncbi:Crp/Fnr family transcriptional regulator [Myroides sp. LoEW2-1]|uniref:Crp/Fnr family transcriptional regulator n=1 Tax=Myroides sp. LoEW2-1 TaxID=2683192 RepID=UPI001327D647|nr:Crp/Fnr family transcriptional regulator [Myroides sp. LoEW2-1]MVX37049.1 cyclic nucleotide-binding domain-containing protein [Myroides sp. LoEW2-1]
MIQQFIAYLQQYCHLTQGEQEALKQYVSIQSIPKQSIIFKQGQISNEIYFVVQGCVRLFYEVEGNDKTAFFYTEGQFICVGESYTFNVPAKENYQVLEDTILCVLTKENIEKLLEISSTFEVIARVAVENELLTSQRIIASFVTQSAEERYLGLLHNKGDLFLRVPQQYIATFLGVSPETLSRIKQRVLK